MTQMRRCFGIAGAVAILLSLAPTATAQQTKSLPPETVRFFETRIRPVLAEHCFKCHGPEKQRGHLRLDSRAGIQTGGEIGSAVDDKNPEQSLILKAIRHDDPEFKMPPSSKLKREQIDDLTRWVKMGIPWPGASETAPTPAKKSDKEITAKDRQFWVFQPVKRPAVPTVKGPVANPVDAFHQAKLKDKPFTMNGPASKGELIRRLYFNLIGLPPTPAQVEAYLNDTSPDAYEKVVDTLLKSPRYGEKWARHWLDLVRYAETNSYERDNPKPHVWRYRDYVIRAFNDDKPYDQFLREQLAGDEMPNPGPDQLIATGFYRLGIWDDEPSDPKQARYDGLDDIVTTVSQGMLGITLDCARCHDHKIDPFQQRDYYRLMAFFHNINHYRNGGPTDEAPILTNSADKTALTSELKRLEERKRRLQEQVAQFEKDAQSLLSQKIGIVPSKSDISDLKYRFYPEAFASLRDFEKRTPAREGTLPDGFFDLSPRTSANGYGLVFDGTLHVPAAGKYAFYLDSDDGSRLHVAGKAILAYDGIHGGGKEKSATVDLDAGRHPIRLEYFQGQFGYGLYTAWSGPGFNRKLLSALPTDRNASGDFLATFKNRDVKGLDPERQAEYRKLKKELDTLKNPTLVASQDRALVVTEPGDKGPDTFVLIRGNPGVPGAKVEPGFPLVLGVPDPPIASIKNPRSSGRRTTLANWMTSRDNPLTARVMVNRLWQHHFGRGIVRSPNNFGYQGDKPSHPELLDWLAAEFMEHGWSIKHLHRLIVTSNAYKMSSRGQAEALKLDPANDTLWRFDMRRLSAEEIRDAILAVSGNAAYKMFGPGIYPEIPKEVLAGQSIPGRGWGKSSPDEQARRSIYVHVKRSLLLPILDSFDLAETDRSAPTRFSSTQPTQALLMLNSEFINQQAGIFADRLRREAGNDVAAQVRLGLHLATSRAPSPEDVRRGVNLITSLTRDDGAAPQEATRFFCLMVLNLNEFMYLD